MARLKIGDIFETGTHAGLLYVQLTDHHAEYGELIRVLEGTHDHRPSEIGSLAGRGDVWLGFYPLGAAVRQGLMSHVGHASVPSERAAFPLFKTAVTDPRTGDVARWWLWDGAREWRVDRLDADQAQLPDRGIVNHEYLLGEVFGHTGPEPRRESPAESRAVHYLYFAERSLRASGRVRGGRRSLAGSGRRFMGREGAGRG